MDALFTADVALSFEDLRAFYIHDELRKGDKVRPSVMVVCGIGALLICTLAYQAVTKFSWYDLAYILVILALPLGRYMILSARARRDHADYEQAGSHSRYEFTEEGVRREKTDGTGTRVSEFKYDDYVRVVQTKRAFYLYVAENEANIIPHGCLHGGSSLDLAKFLDRKLGKSFMIVELGKTN